MPETSSNDLFQDEYENQPVPPDRRRSLLAVASVWAGFPMIITGAITGATLVHGLGFGRGVIAMVIGNLLLLGYVGLLSALGARDGFTFSMQASRTFGRSGYTACSALLSTLVLGWFAVQTGLVGASVNDAFGVSTAVVVIVVGIAFTLFTLLGIRALSIIGMISVPLFLVFGVIAMVRAVEAGGGAAITSYEGPATASIPLGVGVTLVFALFCDSGTMTADFTRWARTSRHAWIATSTAFPVGNLVAMLIGGVIAAAAGATGAGGSGDVFSVIAGGGGWLAALAVVFLLVNMGSVCTHCLYNAAVGWSGLLKSRMRTLTLVLGAVGVVVAALGLWTFFVDWLVLLGVIVPPIGAIILTDQVLFRRAVPAEVSPAVRWQAFAAWVVGSGLAFVVNVLAPGLSTVVAGLVASALAYAACMAVSRREAVEPVPSTAV